MKTFQEWWDSEGASMKFDPAIGVMQACRSAWFAAAASYNTGTAPEAWATAELLNACRVAVQAICTHGDSEKYPGTLETLLRAIKAGEQSPQE